MDADGEGGRKDNLEPEIAQKSFEKLGRGGGGGTLRNFPSFILRSVCGMQMQNAKLCGLRNQIFTRCC